MSLEQSVAEKNLERDLQSALSLIEAGQDEPALEALRAIEANYPGEIDPKGHLAFHWVHLGRYEEALPLYRRLLEMAPDSAEVHLRMGDCYSALGNFKAAYPLYRWLWKNPILTDREWRARLFATEPRLRFLIRKSFLRLPLLLKGIFSPAYAKALGREVLTLRSSRRGIANSGVGAYLEYLKERFLDSNFYAVPIAPCDFCGGADFEPYFFYAHNKVVRCRGCGLQFVERRPPEGFDFERSFFEMPETIEYFESNFWDNPDVLAHTMDLLFNEFKEFGRLTQKPGARLFEIGCAQGRYLSYLRDEGFTVKGLEPSNALAKYAAEAYGLEVECATVGNWSPQEETYEGVLAYHVIEHLDRPSLMFEKAWKTLLPGGLLVLETPVPDLYRSPLPDQLDPSSGFASLGHLYFFTLETIKAYLDKYRFELIRTYEYPTPLPHGGFLARKPVGGR